VTQEIFDALQATLESRGASAFFDQLAEELTARKEHAQLFEILLMKKRHEIGLPIEGTDAVGELPEDVQREVEDYYVHACRRVGGLFLDGRDIPGAWPYFRSIDEPARVAEALEAWQAPTPPPAGETEEGARAKLDAILEIAIKEGVHPRRGFELLLSQHDVCRAITAFEHQLPATGKHKEECGALLVKRLYQDLVESVSKDVAAAGDLRALMAGHPEIFSKGECHVDASHLRSVVRIAGCIRDRGVLELAVQLAEYGRRLPRALQGPESPPFDDFFADWRIFFLALLGTGADGAVRYFRQKADRAYMDGQGKHLPGEALTALLEGLGRHAEALEAHLKYLSSCRETSPMAPPLIALCEKARDFSSLLRKAREKGDFLQFALAAVKGAGAAAEGSQREQR
jgi:hypothetical protein